MSSSGRNVDQEQAFPVWADKVTQRVADLEQIQAYSTPTLWFATVTTRNAFRGILVAGQMCYVASATEFGVTTDIDYRWNGTVWKVWNLPASAGDVAIALSLQGSPAAVVLGTGGKNYARCAIRGRRFNAKFRTYWGTTNGTNPSTSLIWSTAVPIGGLSPGDSDDEVLGAATSQTPSAGNSAGVTRMLGDGSVWTNHWVVQAHAGTALTGNTSNWRPEAGAVYWGTVEFPVLATAA